MSFRVARGEVSGFLAPNRGGQDDDRALAHVEGRFADAERGYADATTQMLRSGSLHAARFYPLALLPGLGAPGAVAR